MDKATTREVKTNKQKEREKKKLKKEQSLNVGSTTCIKSPNNTRLPTNKVIAFI